MSYTGDHSAFDRDRTPSEDEVASLHAAIRDDREQIARLSWLNDLLAEIDSQFWMALTALAAVSLALLSLLSTIWVGHLIGSLGI